MHVHFSAALLRLLPIYVVAVCAATHRADTAIRWSYYE